MSLLKSYRELRSFKKVWDVALEDIISDSSESEKFGFRVINLERPGVGLSGYGTIVFSQMFNNPIPINAGIVNSAINYVVGVIDDDIDCASVSVEEAIKRIRVANNFIIEGSDSHRLSPFRDYLISELGTGYDSLVEILQTYKEVAINQARATSLELPDTRIDVGKTYGRLISWIINHFSETELSDEQVEAIEKLSIGAVHLDDSIDMRVDRENNEPNQFGTNTFSGAIKGFGMAKKSFSEGLSLLSSDQKESYRNFARTTMLCYAINGMRKEVAHNAGKIFFTQYRVGKDGVPFKMIKLKTMRDPISGEVDESRESNVKRVPDYQRVTRIGSFLRRTWLDEVPQLYNVLRGDMSLFGLRPQLIHENLDLTSEHRARRNAVKPGMGDMAVGLVAKHGISRSEAEIMYLDSRNNTPLYDLKGLVTLANQFFAGNVRGF